jgi:rhodanese-related sulfurtransferase/DNA-binding transcriptional ArsR family regulator
MSPGNLVRDKLYEQFARIGHAMSTSKRLELLELLSQCEKDVETLAEHTQMSTANTSRHLQVLRGAGLVEARRAGLHVFYRLADEHVWELLNSMRRLADSRLADVDRIMAEMYSETDELEPIDRVHLLQLAKAGDITILDVRPEDEYRAAHLPHALSVPLPKLKTYLNKLPREQKIVAFCRGPYCLLAREALKIMRGKGFDAVRMKDGISEWRRARMPIETE